VCKEIQEEVYPQELIDAFPGPSVDREALERWFANRARVGEGAARQMANTYLLFLEANPSNQESAVGSTPAPRQRATPSTGSRKSAQQVRDAKNTPDSTQAAVSMPPSPTPASWPTNSPALHIDVQIHIAADATPQQIDAIFASMAKHLYGRDAENGK
jgi:hypothetical protein